VANAEATRRKLAASAASTNKIAGALATEALFTNQMAAVQGVARGLRAAFVSANARAQQHEARKFIVAVTNAQKSSC